VPFQYLYSHLVVVFDVFRISSINYYILVTIDSCQSYSPWKTSLHFSLNAIKASVGGVTDGLFDASDQIEGSGVVVW